jgi:hypothetical protein
MEKESIFLPPRSLASILQMAYSSSSEIKPAETLALLLEPYYITYGQLQSLISILFWPGRLSCSTMRHPAYLTTQRLEKYMECDALTKSDVLKKYFICAATMISHLWYTKYCENKKRYMLHKNLFCVAYEYADSAVPFVWFSFDAHGLPTVMKYHPNVPPIKMEVQRSTKAGALNTLAMQFFEKDKCLQQGYSNLSIQVFNGTFMGIQSLKETPKLVNYMLIISEETSLVRCILVSPSTDQLWNMPVILHQYE